MSTREVSINGHDHGAFVDNQKRKVKCNYCDKVVSGFSRLKYHLGGIRGDVAPCSEVPSELRELMRKEVLDKKDHLSNEVGELTHPNLPWKRNWSSGSDQVQHNATETAQAAGGSRQPKRVRTDPILERYEVESVSLSSGREDPLLRKFQKHVGKFFYEAGIDLSAANSPSFKQMMNAALDGGSVVYNIPTPHELKGWILSDELEEVHTYVNKIRNSWPITGCSILLDGWNDGKGRDLVNVLVDCPKGTVYLRSFDISTSAGEVDALHLFFDEVLEEVGVDNVVQIVAYSVSACMETVGKEIMDKHRTLFWTVSASHCIDLMLEKFAKMDAIKGVLEMAKAITKFFHGHAALVKLLEDHHCGCCLVKPAKYRSAGNFFTLENIVSKKDNLVAVFLSSDWTTSNWASQRDGRRVAELVKDRSFWTGATMVLKAATPLMRVLELLNEGDPEKQRLGYIYETIDQAKEAIKEEFKKKKSQYMPFWEEIDLIWDTYLHSPLHAAAYFLNPAFFYASDFYVDKEVASGLLCCIVCMAKSRNVQDLMILQVDKYCGAVGSFGEGCAANRRLSVAPASWWSTYGAQCPELQKLAIRILSQTCDGALKYGLKRDLAEQLLITGRNPVEQQRLADLTYIHYNTHLEKFRCGTSIILDEIDPMEGWVEAEMRPVSGNAPLTGQATQLSSSGPNIEPL